MRLWLRPGRSIFRSVIDQMSVAGVELCNVLLTGDCHNQLSESEDSGEYQ